MTNPNTILTAAKLVVPGAICGDIIGSQYEFHSTYDYNFQLLSERSQFTDDTVCTIAVADALNKGIPYDESLQYWCRKYRRAGYGGMFRHWIDCENPMPYNSFGNGSAMRVSAPGVLGKTLEDVLRLSRESAEVTHNHPEGIKGAQATATSIFFALRGMSKKEIKTVVETAFDYDLSRDYEITRQDYGFDETCQGSVPESIMSFLESSDYESAVRHAVYMGGDADTMAAIAGGIAAAYYKDIPSEILDACFDRLPAEMIDVIDEFNSHLDRVYESGRGK